MSFLPEGGEQSYKNDSVVVTSEVGNKIPASKKMQTLSSVRRIEKPNIKNEISKISNYSHNPERGILNKYHNISDVGPGSYTIPGSTCV